MDDRKQISFSPHLTGSFPQRSLAPSSSVNNALLSPLSAFTLVELLVAISIIALLLAILSPSLRYARAQAQTVLCQTQLRQWGMTFTLYANVHNDFYPHIDGLDRRGDEPPRSPADWADYYGWVDVIPPLMDEKPWRDYPNRRHPTRDTVFQCPSARLDAEDIYDYYPAKNGYFSYAMNSCLELDRNCWRHPEDTSVPMPSFLKTTLIQNPAGVVLLFDQLLDPRKGYNAQHLYRSAGKHCGVYPKSFSARHARSGGTLGGSLLFCDTHVEWKDTVWKPHWPEDLEVPPRTDRQWYPYPPKYLLPGKGER